MGKTKHGMYGTRLYSIWKNMINRCYYSRYVDFDRYGGRGIKVCTEWRENPQSFYDWAISNGYSDDLSIDRIDVNGDYCPENCRWATAKEQGNNRSNNRVLTFKGKTQTVSQWAKELKISESTIRTRLWRGWSVEKTLSPARNYKNRRNKPC